MQGFPELDHTLVGLVGPHVMILVTIGENNETVYEDLTVTYRH